MACTPLTSRRLSWPPRPAAATYAQGTRGWADPCANNSEASCSVAACSSRLHSEPRPSCCSALAPAPPTCHGIADAEARAGSRCSPYCVGTDCAPKPQRRPSLTGQPARRGSSLRAASPASSNLLHHSAVPRMAASVARPRWGDDPNQDRTRRCRMDALAIALIEHTAS